MDTGPTLPTLSMLRSARTSYSLAFILGVEHRYLTYMLYKFPDARRYTTTTIPKKGGGVRELTIPHRKLRDIQHLLSKVLLNARNEIATIERGVLASSYGFESKRSIYENAQKHVGKRHVFNLDLENFFGSIRYGQLKGVLEKDRNFALSPKVAEMIAQLCCYESRLPQGAPTSPVAANIVATILDRRIRKLSNKARCTYTRYADDLTFSTNKKEFPSEIGVCNNGVWEVGKDLSKIIKKTGFVVNSKKVRMEASSGRQTVTGLTVNNEVNVPMLYRRLNRSMCHSLFTTGKYFIKEGDANKKLTYESLHRLEGRVQFCAHIAKRKQALTLPPTSVGKKRSKRVSKKTSDEALAEDFVFFKNFNLASRPVIVTEGYTDYLYLLKTRTLPGLLPSSLKSAGEYNFKVLKPSYRTQEVLQIGNGTGDVMRFVREYKAKKQRAPFSVSKEPTIILLDSDKNGSDTWKALKKMSIEIGGQERSLGSNLYAVYLSHLGDGKEIENYFELSLLSEKIGGRSFDLLFPDAPFTYRKIDFAKKVVAEQANPANSKNFSLIFKSFEVCISHSKLP